jgi:hypothetical protein
MHWFVMRILPVARVGHGACGMLFRPVEEEHFPFSCAVVCSAAVVCAERSCLGTCG